jgi:hypothetical protein
LKINRKDAKGAEISLLKRKSLPSLRLSGEKTYV